MKDNAFWPVVVNNCVVTISWTILAIYFGHWWVAFFAALFLARTKSDD